MMSFMSVSISALEATQRFPDLLARVLAGESFVIVRDGKAIGQLLPAGAEAGPQRRPATFQSLVDLVREHGFDEEFADDLEQIQRDQPKLESDPWDS